MERIDNNSIVPLYHQLYEILLKQIKDGTYLNGERLPSESELCDTYDISRITVRKAVEELEKEGLVEKKRGKGVFVVKPVLKQNLKGVYSFSREMEKAGKISRTKVLEVSVEKASVSIAAQLGIEPGKEVLKISRLRYADSRPQMYERTYFDYSKYHELMDVDLESVGSLYQYVKDFYNVEFTSAQEKINACAISKKEKELLKIDNGVAYGLQMKRITYFNNEIICCSNLKARGDTFQLIVDL